MMQTPKLREKVFRDIDFCIGPKSTTRNWTLRKFLKLEKFVLMPEFHFFLFSFDVPVMIC